MTDPDHALPSVELCVQRAQALATLDTVLSPKWESRYYSFNSQWAPGERLASMRDGEGSHSFMLFVGSGCIYKTFDHEAPPGADLEARTAAVRAQAPELYRAFFSEPAFMVEDWTRIGWSDKAQGAWVLHLSGQHEDTLLALIEGGDPEAYLRWATGYFGTEVLLDAVEAVFRHQPLTPELARQLHPEVNWTDLRANLAEIGYPCAG